MVYKNFFLRISITLLLLIIVLCQLANRQIGGYTGDYLGFSQQISEVVVYIVGVSLWISA